MRFVIALALVLLAAGAQAHDDDESTPVGKPGLASMADRTVTVMMDDTMRFTPAGLAVKEGETIRFVIKNAGAVRHEMMIGSIEEMHKHAELMRQFPEMEHEDGNAVTLDPGKEGEIAWKFTVPGTFEYACLVPGHYEAGMRGRIVVGVPTAVAAHDHAPPDTVSRPPGGGIGRGDGDVRRIDTANGKITLRHGPLVGLKGSDGKDMPGMTMVFRVRNPAQLTALKVGDKVRFVVARENGALIVEAIEPAR